MAADWVELGKEVLKLAVRARYSFTLWVVSLIILVVPLPNFLLLEVIRKEYSQWVGLICLTMFVVWFVEVVLIGANLIRVHIAARREENKVLKYLDSLNSREAHLLAAAVSSKCQTVSWRTLAEEGSSLVAKGLLMLVPHKNTPFTTPYTIPQFVWEHISRADVNEKLKALDNEKKV